MIDAATAIKRFASNFGLPAYSVDSVPDPVETPYITFPVKQPEWNAKTSFYLQVWYRTTSNTEVLTKADEICRAIGTGIMIDLDNGGHLVIWPETPLIQLMVDGDYRSAYINLSINVYSLPGM